MPISNADIHFYLSGGDNDIAQRFIVGRHNEKPEKIDIISDNSDIHGWIPFQESLR